MAVKEKGTNSSSSIETEIGFYFTDLVNQLSKRIYSCSESYQTVKSDKDGQIGYIFYEFQVVEVFFIGKHSDNNKIKHFNESDSSFPYTCKQWKAGVKNTDTDV